MKNLMTLGALLLFTQQLFAQLTYSSDSSTITMSPGVTKNCSITLTNSGNHDIQVSWRLINSNIQDFGDPNGAWSMSWCDCNMCSSNDFTTMRDSDTCQFPMNPGDISQWYILIDPIIPTYTDGKWIIEVFNHTDNIKDTLTYVFLGQPAPPSQLVFNSTTSIPQFTTGRVQKSEISFKNNWNHDVQLSWRVLNSSLMDYGNPNGAWDINFSACSNVHDNSTHELIQADTCPNVMLSGDSATWALTIDPNSLEIMNAFWEIEMFNHTDFSRDTLTYVFINSPVSVKETEEVFSVYSYPNPANERLTIHYKHQKSNDLELSVYTLLGELVYSSILSSSNSQFRLNTLLLPSGMYFYSIKGDDSTMPSSRFVVQH